MRVTVGGGRWGVMGVMGGRWGVMGGERGGSEGGEGGFR